MAALPVHAVETGKPGESQKLGQAKMRTCHPKYSVMVAETLAELNDRSGSSRVTIRRHILATYPVDARWVAVPLRLALKRGLADGSLKKAKETGKGPYKYKLAERIKTEKIGRKLAAVSLPEASPLETGAGGKVALLKTSLKQPLSTVSPKKTSAKKTPLKKASPMKAAPNEASPKKASPKKASLKKASPKKASPKKASLKMASPKKASPKKASPKKASPKKASPKKASRRDASHKASGKKATPKENSPEKGSLEKALLMKTKPMAAASKKTGSKRV
jgi:hypothetical protein